MVGLLDGHAPVAWQRVFTIQRHQHHFHLAGQDVAESARAQQDARLMRAWICRKCACADAPIP